VRQQLQELLDDGTSKAPVSQFLRLAGQEMLEQEVTDYLGRERYERREEEQQGYRNGYEPALVPTAARGVTTPGESLDVWRA
jgi:transposase-like protein